jgi:hypothetical protein
MLRLSLIRELRRRVSQCLPRNRERLIVHVFVKNGQQDKINIAIIEARGVNPIDNPISNIIQILHSRAS